MIIIDKEFQEFLPQNDAETKAELEKLIIADGCRDPIVLWNQYKCDCGADLSVEEYETALFSNEFDKFIMETNKKWNCAECNDEFSEKEMRERGIIIDGHHRYEICTRLNIPFQTIQKEFNSRYDVLSWMFDNQNAKRNLNNFERSEVALKLEGAFKAIAKENQLATLKQNATVLQNSAKRESIDTRAEIAKKANVSHDTIHKAKTILNSAPAEVIQAVRSGEMSVNQAFNAVKSKEKKETMKQNGFKKAGDHNSVKLTCGDSLELIKTIDDNSIDLVCVDPPYNMDKADWDSYGSGKEFADWCESWLNESYRVLKPSGSIYVFGINRMLSHIQHRMEKIGFSYRNWITWDTIQGAGGGLWVNRHEDILFFSKTNKFYADSESIKLERSEENIREYKGVSYQFKNPSNVWRFPCVDSNNKDRTNHPTQKPVEIIERIILASCPADGVVLDLFMGSGTTGVAAIKTGRKAIGFEMNPDYIEIAKNRFHLAGSNNV